MVVPRPAGEFDPVALENSLMEVWRSEGTFTKSIESRRAKGTPFTFRRAPHCQWETGNPSCNLETVQGHGVQMEDDARACG